jgi:hypothetical protein
MNDGTRDPQPPPIGEWRRLFSAYCSREEFDAVVDKEVETALAGLARSLADDDSLSGSIAPC